MFKSPTIAAAFAAGIVAASSVWSQAAPFTCPKTGGDLNYALEADAGNLDVHTSLSQPTRNVGMNVFEALMTRDENYNIIPELAESATTSPDGLTYTFKLRQGVKFHNGKAFTSADVVGSYDRYKRIGVGRSVFQNVASWEAPDDFTFVVHMASTQPTFLEEMSGFARPITIIPAEEKDAEPGQSKPIGTGPFKVAEILPNSYVKLVRFDEFTPNAAFENRDGYGGYKVACLDSVTLRTATEPGARVAGLEAGDFDGVESVPALSYESLKANKDLSIVNLENWFILLAFPNLSLAPNDDINFRKAVQAALNIDDILEASTDGFYKKNVGFLFNTQAQYSTAGSDTYNINNVELAKELLKKSKYKGEEIILLTNKDFDSMYKTALVTDQQLQAIGIKTRLDVVDFPTMLQRQGKEDDTWHFVFTATGTSAAVGPVASMALLVPPANNNNWKDGEVDPEFMAAFNDMRTLTDPAARQEAFDRMQKLALDRAYAYPFGTLTRLQANRKAVSNFQPYRTVRFANVWLDR